MSVPLSFHLLGGAAINFGDEPPVDLRSRTAEALLIFLACHDQPQSRQFLADFFWDDRSQKQASANLRAVLSMLRKLPGDYLIVDRQTAAFDHSKEYWLDSAVFERQIRALELSLSLATALDDKTHKQLAATMSLYQGDFLSGFYLSESRGFDEWVVVTRERLRRLAVLGLRRLVQYSLANGRYQEGIRYADRLTAADPYNEEAVRQQMWLLLRSGRRNAALQFFQRFEALLAEDLNVEPSPTTTAAYEQITALSFPPPHNITISGTPFIGREEEIRALQTELLRPENRLITIVGPGGVGKTTLAGRLGHQITTFQPGYFLHGVWFVPLAPVLSPRFLETAVAKSLNITFGGPASPRDQLLKQLQNREMLLILDNFEHLLVGDETGLALVENILTGAPGVKLLVTSREQLNLREEQIFDIEGLPYPQETELPLETAVNYSAVALFIEGAKRVSRRFEAGSADMSTIIQICRLLEGMPLALEMASAWVRQASLQEILDQIQQSFDSLETTWHNIPQRHRSLQAVFDHSWQLLTDEEKRGFSRLAIFQGGFSPGAALAVADVSKPSIYQNKSLLRREEIGRFTIHNLIHQFTAEILRRDGETYQIVQHNHAHYYLELLHQQASVLVSETAKASLDLIGREIENIRLAWHWALANNALDLLDQAYLSLYQFYEMQGWLEEGQSLFNQTTTRLKGQLGNVEDLAGKEAVIFGRLFLREGWFTYRVGQIARAGEIIEACVVIFRRLGEEKDLAQALNDLGLLARRDGDYERGRQLFQESLTIRRKMGDSQGIAISLNNMANAVRFLGEYNQARGYLLESLELLQEQGNQILLANVTNDLGEIYRATGDYVSARKYYEDSLAIRQKIGIRPGIAMCLNNLGSIAHTLGDYESARRYARESLEVDIETGDKRAMPYPLSVLGRIARDEGDFAASFSAFRRALQICQEIDYIPKSLDILFELATVLEAMNQPARAVRLLAFVIDHPKINHETRKAAEALQGQLVELLTAETAEKMKEAGRLKSLDSVLLKVLRGEWLAKIEDISG